MPFCKNCGKPFEWGWDDGNDRWVLLEPVGTDDDLHKSFVDENGNYRADHRDRCNGGVPTVTVQRLRQLIPPGEEGPEVTEPIESVGEAQDAIASETGWFEKMRARKFAHDRLAESKGCQ
jgi:hypothetical protein